ncbi:hypothetical protein PT974_04404 [Cladobotryum mycophilum]|uniref:IBR domain-containing protein n=1 Tax=Cladobotryum mycophilum TaxID=491253 RepID=A0ABR0SV27_9HYPO
MHLQPKANLATILSRIAMQDTDATNGQSSTEQHVGHPGQPGRFPESYVRTNHTYLIQNATGVNSGDQNSSIPQNVPQPAIRDAEPASDSSNIAPLLQDPLLRLVVLARCCELEFDTRINEGIVPPELLARYDEKRLEYAEKKRTYCHQPTCSAFVAPEFIDENVATCPKCNGRTCVACGGAAHADDCPVDTSMQQLLQTADENGWKRCKSCDRMVEQGASAEPNSATYVERNGLYAHALIKGKQYWPTFKAVHGRLESLQMAASTTGYYVRGLSASFVYRVGSIVFLPFLNALGVS